MLPTILAYQNADAETSDSSNTEYSFLRSYRVEGTGEKLNLVGPMSDSVQTGVSPFTSNLTAKIS